MTNRPLRVFLCHSSNDKPAVRELYQKLRAETWIEPWLDEEELYPGQDWNIEIEKAVEASDAIIVCLTKNSINKEGYVQRELRLVLDVALTKPEDTIFLIPLRLEECDLPRRLRTWQSADYFEGQRERALDRLLVSLNKRAESLNLKVEAKVELISPKLPNEVSTFTVKNIQFMKGDIPFGLTFRLPTEAEWEKAARSIDERKYPWGNDFGGKCNSKESDNGSTTPVGQYSPYGDSPYGCADMAGNVWEWTHSIEKSYPYDSKDGREGESLDVARVIRGGAYFNYYWGVNSAYRIYSKPDGFWDGLGFRIVLSVALSKLRSKD